MRKNKRYGHRSSHQKKIATKGEKSGGKRREEEERERVCVRFYSEFSSFKSFFFTSLSHHHEAERERERERERFFGFFLVSSSP
mgnify:CR=1 FL=1